MLVLVVALASLSDPQRTQLASLLGLATIAVAASLSYPQRLAPWVPVAEAVAATLIMVASRPFDPNVLPYLIAPAFAAGITFGARMAVTAIGLATLVLLAARATSVADEPIRPYVADVATWVTLGLAAGLVGAALRRADEEADPDRGYLEAYRLLAQLHAVSRQLSDGLDPQSQAQVLLQNLRVPARYSRAAVFVRGGEGDLLVPLSHAGADRVPWGPDDGHPVWASALATLRPAASTGSLSDPSSGFSAAFPFVLGDRAIGVVGVERDEAPFSQEALDDAQRLVEDASLRLDTALLFGEVRTIATTDERRRLAREIHDGIAQEIASLGYAVDDLRRSAETPAQQRGLDELRAELSRVVSELRLSIFDLRSDLLEGGGLGAALSEYARRVGTLSGLTVHLLIDESPTRLRVEAESELMRVAQEAITNARKHARARRLWVTCVVDPPSALMRVEDDGRGLAPGRRDSYGLEIMRERVDRLGGALAIEERPGGGTRIEVVVGEPRGRVRSALAFDVPQGTEPWLAPGSGAPTANRKNGGDPEGGPRADHSAAR
jgi:signal transduction histidine kinase